MRVKFCVDTQLRASFLFSFFLSWLGSFFAHACVFLVQHCMILLDLACEQALCLGKKNSDEREGRGGGREPVDKH